MNKKNIFNQKLITYFFIIVGYLSLMTFFLYLPKIKTFFIKDQSIYVYAFVDMISIDTIKEFEKKYGIKVSVKYFDSNEELFAKFKISKGEGFDLITPSDYMIEKLRQEGLLAKLDHTKIPLIKHLDSRFMNRYFDPENKYSLPYFWTAYGIVYNKKIFKKPIDSLDIIFKHPKHFAHLITQPLKICMLEEFREAAFFASQYLFGYKKQLSNKDIKKIKDLLMQQKQWIETYLHQDMRYYLFSEVFHVAITSSSYIKRVLELSNDFAFVIPKEGSLLSIENLAIPKKSKKKDLTHTFINFLLTRENLCYNSQEFGYNPANKLSYQDIPEKLRKNPNFFPDDRVFATLYLLRNDLPIKKLNDMWWEVKSS